jgi:DNA/RNA endonuclease YhcR with UshA esterase domain
VTVTALTNRTTYHFKVFVQYGNTWSAGVSVQSTPFSIQSFPLSSISTMVGVNSSGALDSLGARARLSGTVYGINQYSSSTTPVGVQYVIMDQTGGIMLRRAGTNFGYSGGTALSEGDSVECLGVLEQYNGLTQLNCDTIIRVATGRTLALPAVVNTLDESTENRLVRLNGLVLVGSNWPTGPITSGVNVDVSNGATIFQMRILPQTDIDGTPAPTGYFDLVGLGLQYDNSSPFTSGYQIAPRSLADFTAIPVVNTTANFARVDTLVSNQTGPIGMNVAIMNPHPVAQTLKVKVNTSPGAVYGVTYETFPVPVNDTITLNVPANASSVPFSVLLYAAVPSGRTDTLGFTMFGASPGISAGIANNSTIRVMSLSVPTYSIGLLRGGNNGGNIAGIPDSNGVYAKATGIVLGGNRRLTPTAGLEFFIFDPGSNAGIGVFRNSNFAAVPFQVTEGDLIRVIGTVSHFNGLGQFNADSIVVISSGNALPAPQVVSAMNENTECRLIRIDNLTLVPSTSTSAQWPVSGATGSGRTPKATNGVDTFDIRIDNDINLFNSPAPTGTFSMIGVGSQYDVSDPRTSGYQLCPRYLPDLLQAVAYSISGTVTYNNSTSTPMTNSLVRIKDGSGTVVASDSTDALGAYVMATVPAGSYTLDAVTSKPWGGVTASDALGISRHFSGSVPLTGLRLSAADVNGSSSITSGDALVVNRRFSGSLAAFSVGDWISERPALNVSANVTQDFKMLAFGDVNGSYVPNSSLRLSGTGMNLMTGSDRVHWDLSSNLIKVTLRADRAMELGAVSLELPLPAGLEVVGMEPGNAKGHSSWGHRDGMWCFGWFDESAMMVNENDAVVIVTLRADRPEILEQLDWTTVRLGAQSELTDVWGQEIQGNLRVPSFKASTTSITMYPNPTTGDLRLVWGGNATSAPSEVMVRDLTGRVVAGYNPAQEALHLNMDLSSVPAGSYTVEVHWNPGNGLSRVERSILVVRP